MNSPAHFKQQLAEELNAHATSLSAPTGHRAVLRLHAPHRRVALTLGIAAAAAAVALAVPLVSGSHDAPLAAPSPHTSASTGALNVVNADYAVRSKPGGMVSVQLFDQKGVPGLQAALDKAGVPAKVLVRSASCHTGGHAGGHPHGSLLKVAPPSGFHSTGVRDIKPAAIAPGDHLLFVVDSQSGPVTSLSVQLVRQPPRCVPAD